MGRWRNRGNYDIYNNYVYNFDHGIAYGVASGSHGTITIHNNHFGSMTAWDNTAIPTTMTVSTSGAAAGGDYFRLLDLQ